MSSQRTLLGALVLAGFHFSTAGAAHAQAPVSFSLTDLGVVSGTAASTAAIAGVNSFGQIAGTQTQAYTYTTSGGTVVNTTYQRAFDSGANATGFNSLGAGTGTANATTGLPATSQASGINDSGIVVGRTYASGTYNDPTYGALSFNNINHAYRLNSGSESAISGADDLGTLGQAAYKTSTGSTGTNASEAFAINASGQIAGASQANVDGGAVGFSFHVFRINAGESSLSAADDLGTLTAGNSSYGTAISSTGQVAGYGTPAATNQTHAFRMALGESKISASDDIGTIGSNTFQGVTYNNSFAYGINTSGQVVGTSTTTVTGQMHAFRSSANGAALALTDLGTLPGQLSISSSALGIDTAGDVVGYDQLNSGINNAFFYANATSTMYNLNDLLSSNPFNVVLNVAYGITDNGNIVAYGTEGSTVHAFLLSANSASSAAPEPMPVVLLTFGLAIVGVTVRRRTDSRPKRS